jgi:hypothetical protein
MEPKHPEIAAIAKKLDEQGAKIDEQGQMVKEIHLFVAGNDKYGQKGLKHRLEELEEKDKQRDKDENKKLIKAGAIGGGVGSLITVIAPKTILAKMWAALISLIF